MLLLSTSVLITFSSSLSSSFSVLSLSKLASSTFTVFVNYVHSSPTTESSLVISTCSSMAIRVINDCSSGEAPRGAPAVAAALSA